MTTDPTVRAVKRALFRLETGEINLSRFKELVVEAAELADAERDQRAMTRAAEDG